MSEHIGHIHWRAAGEFSATDYNKQHVASAAGQSWNMASANTEQHVDPEQALAVSLASCHMLTFLALAAKKRLVVVSYEDNPKAIVTQNEQGLMHVSQIHLSPKVQFADESPVTLDALKKMHDKAHHHCFIANSIKSEVVIHVAQ